MRSDFRLIFVQMARLGPIVFEDVLCRHYELAYQLFGFNDSGGDSHFDEVVQHSTSSDWSLDASNFADWEATLDHSELMDGLSVVFNLADACTDANLEFDFLADFLADIGSEHYKAEDFLSSMECFVVAQRYAEQCGNVTGVADIHERIGDVHFRKQILVHALGSFQQALLNREAFRDFRGVGRCLSKIGEVLETSGQRGDAIRYFQGAIQVLAKHGAPIDRAPVHDALGSTYASNRQVEDAREQLLKARNAWAQYEELKKAAEVQDAVEELESLRDGLVPLQANPMRRLPCDEKRLVAILQRAEYPEPGRIEFRGPMVKQMERNVAQLKSLLDDARNESEGDAESS